MEFHSAPSIVSAAIELAQSNPIIALPLLMVFFYLACGYLAEKIL